MKDPHISILGAGIAGLTTALALYQAGFGKLKVYEQRASGMSGSGGAGFVLWPNACNILHRLGLLDEVKKEGANIVAMQQWSDKGDYLNQLDLQPLEVKMRFPSLAVSRKALYGILLKKVLALGIPIRNAWKVENISFTGPDDRLGIEFQNGEKRSADIIIGADGRMFSVAREFVLGSNKPIYQNFVNWVGLSEEPSDLLPGAKILDFWGCGERFGIVPLKGGGFYWAGCKAFPNKYPTSGIEEKEQLLSIFANWPPLVKAVIDKTSAAHIRRIEMYDHDPTEKWYRHSVCLIGDAAHAALPTSGQGACQAIEDAWHFAESLKRNRGCFPSAFSQFMDIRKKKTAAITLAARNFAHQLFNTQPAFCHRRNENARLADPEAQVQGMIKLWSEALP